MKKTVLLLAVFCVAIPAFAQNSWDTSRRDAVMFNPGAFIIGTTVDGFGIGLAYEHAFDQQVTAKANAYFLGYNSGERFNQLTTSAKDFTATFMFSLEGRWYPLERHIEGIFLSGGLQYHLLSGTIISYDWETSEDIRKSGVYHTVGIVTGFGYKVVFGKSRFGLALEPTIDYTWPFFSTLPYIDEALDHASLAMSAMGIQGIRIGLQFGVAF